jgi:hypothetical protein
MKHCLKIKKNTLVNNKQDQTLPKNKVKKYFGKQQTGSNIV